MKKGLTEIVFILDESGSMSGLEKDTVGGFNSFIKEQRKIEGEALVSVVLFNENSKLLYDRVELSKIETMTENQYCPGGCTALLDAVGNALNHIRTIHKYAWMKTSRKKRFLSSPPTGRKIPAGNLLTGKSKN